MRTPINLTHKATVQILFIRRKEEGDSFGEFLKLGGIRVRQRTIRPGLNELLLKSTFLVLVHVSEETRGFLPQKPWFKSKSSFEQQRVEA
jgi:hypothetical protein